MHTREKTRQRGRRREGSTTVMALMVSLLLMVLITATMALTMVDTQLIQDYARNKKTVQAADSGLVHSSVRLAHAVSSLNLEPNVGIEDVSDYADDAESGIREGDMDVSLLKDSGEYFTDILPRDSDTTYGSTEYTPEGLYVGYGAAVDIYPTSVERPDSDDISHTHLFHYDYRITSAGSADIGGQHNEATRTEEGSFDVEVKRPSFATYGYFTQSMKNQFNDQLWFFDGEVYGGPTHVNSAPPEGRAAFWGSPTFNSAFSAVQERYEDSYLGGDPNPQFNGSVSWGVDPIDLPENGWSQLRAAVGDLANVDNPSNPTNPELRTLLQIDVSEDPVDQGVYYAGDYNEGASLLGGIFVNGDAASISFDVSSDEQIITIEMSIDDGGEFDGDHIWEFRDNIDAGVMHVTLDGSPAGNFNENFNGVIHTEGAVDDLGGDGTLAGADVENAHGITVSVKDDIYITDHITYEESPLVYPDAENILGVFSSNGNIYLAQEAPNDLNMHATVMAASDDHGVGAEGIYSGGSYLYSYPNKGNWTLVGGLIENKNQTTGVFYSDGHVTGYLWDFHYDERFLKGVAPPYFPYVTKFLAQLMNMQASNWGRAYY